MNSNSHHKAADATEQADSNRRYRETESQSERATDATEATHEVPPLTAPVASLKEAVQISLKEGVHENVLFHFARALKAFEATTRIRLQPADLTNAFSLWWSLARERLSQGADFDEFRFFFEDAFQRVRSPLGANPLKEAVRRADATAPPREAERYGSSKLRRLVAVCSHLQAIAGDAPFFLSVRDAARIIDTTRLHDASAILNGLVRDGILAIVAKGSPGGRRATRFRFLRTTLEGRA